MSSPSFYEVFRQPYVLNIFCDASLRHRGEATDICYGSIAVNKDNIIDSIYRVNTDSTNNRGEAMALLAGLYLAIKYRNTYSVINIFSDSQVSIFNVRDRYIDWRFVDGDYYIKSGGVLSNQDVYTQILYTICEYDSGSDITVKFTFDRMELLIKNARLEECEDAARLLEHARKALEKEGRTLLVHSEEHPRIYHSALRVWQYNCAFQPPFSGEICPSTSACSSDRR